MNKHKKIIFSILISPIILAILGVGALYLDHKRNYIDPYNQFREMQFQVLPKLDELNKQTYQELPAFPDGFRENGINSSGIEVERFIGRWMVISLVGPEDGEEFFFDYYNDFLMSTNWTFQKESYIPHYYKETSCIALLANPPNYFIRIWQDFEQQPFVDEIPSADILTLRMYESWIIARCPSN